MGGFVIRFIYCCDSHGDRFQRQYKLQPGIVYFIEYAKFNNKFQLIIKPIKKRMLNYIDFSNCLNLNDYLAR